MKRSSTIGVALLVLLALPASAQQDAARAGREREALRRTQAALKQAQEQQAGLSREKSELSAEKDRLAANVKHAETQLGNARGESSRLHADLARIGAELEALRGEAAAQKQAAQASSDALAERLSRAERLLAERTQTVASITALLERSTQALAAAEKANGEMQAFGLQLIARLRDPSGAAGQADAVLGFGQVRLENTAEQLRDRLDALKLSQGR
jgi:chromosome segregation ATPase